MNKANTTVEQKKQLNRKRQQAVREAWSKEKERVSQGEGKRLDAGATASTYG